MPYNGYILISFSVQFVEFQSMLDWSVFILLYTFHIINVFSFLEMKK